MRTEQQHRGDLLAQVSWLVNVSHFLTLLLREAWSAHTDKVLAYLSCSYRLNHYLELQQALGIDPSLAGITRVKHQPWEGKDAAQKNMHQSKKKRTPLKVPEHTTTERQKGFSSNSLTSMHRCCAFSCIFIYALC